MTFRVEYRNGMLVPDEPLNLAEGTRLEIGRAVRIATKTKRARPGKASKKAAKRSSKDVDPRATKKATKPRRGSAARGRTPTLLDVFAPIVGVGTGLPADFSVNHDHYVYGVPKHEA